MTLQLIIATVLLLFHETIASDSRFLAGCLFPEEGNEEIVQLLCENSGGTDQSDMCYSLLFEDDSQNDERSNVTTLKTNGCGDFGDIFKNFTNLIELDISSDFHHTDFDLSSSSLKIFRAANTSLVEIPTNLLAGFPKLSALDLSANHIKALLNSTFKATDQLTSIDLSYNNIDTVQRGTFSRFEKLHSLNLSHNRIDYLDVGDLVGNLKELQVLNVNVNGLTSLGNVTQLSASKLSLLGISNNRIDCEYLKQFLERLDLDAFDFIGDPFRQNNMDCPRSVQPKNKRKIAKIAEEKRSYFETRNIYANDLNELAMICLVIVTVVLGVGAVFKCHVIPRIWQTLTTNQKWNRVEEKEIMTANNGRYSMKTDSKDV